MLMLSRLLYGIAVTLLILAAACAVVSVWQAWPLLEAALHSPHPEVACGVIACAAGPILMLALICLCRTTTANTAERPPSEMETKPGEDPIA